MSGNNYEIYETLVSGIDGDAVIEDWCLGRIWAAVKAGLLIVLVFALVFFLFLCFTDFVWFGNSL